jgi:hypothetical protein
VVRGSWFVVAGVVVVVSSCKPDGGINDGLTNQYEDGVSEVQVARCEFAAAGFHLPDSSPVLDVPVPLPLQYRAWRDSALEADPERAQLSPYVLPNAGPGEDIPANNLYCDGFCAAEPRTLRCARYASTIVHTDLLCDQQHALRQQEAMLFARDPEEMFETLENPDFVNRSGCNWEDGSCAQAADAEWKQQTSESGGPVALPRVVSIPYPPEQATPQVPGLGAGEIWSTDPLAVGDFWPPGSQLAGPGKGPHGASSVKSIAAVQHGFCSHYADLATDVYPMIADMLWNNYKNGVRPSGDCGQCLNLDRDYVHLATFLHQDADETTDQHGGFFLQFAFRNEFCHMNFTTDTARYNVAFEWQLTSDGGFVRDMLATPPRRLDGRPVPVPVFKDGNTGGHDSVDLHFAFDAALSGSREGGSSLPRSIYETVDKLLVYAGAGCLPARTATRARLRGPRSADRRPSTRSMIRRCRWCRRRRCQWRPPDRTSATARMRRFCMIFMRASSAPR